MLARNYPDRPRGCEALPVPADMEEDRRSVLVTIGQLREGLVLSARDEEAAQAVAAGLQDAKAANTRRVYAPAWHEFNV